MKARINILAIVFAAGMLTALAEEPKTNAPTSAAPGLPANTNEIAVPPSMPATSAPAPVAPRKVKPPVVVPLTPTNAVPAQTNITAMAPTPGKSATSAPPAAGEARAPEEDSLTPTGAVSASSDVTPVSPPESSGLGRMGVWGIGVALLVVLGGLAVFLLRRQGKADHASLITRAMSETKDDDKHEDKHEEKKGDTAVTRKTPPPMN